MLVISELNLPTAFHRPGLICASVRIVIVNDRFFCFSSLWNVVWMHWWRHLKKPSWQNVQAWSNATRRTVSSKSVYVFIDVHWGSGLGFVKAGHVNPLYIINVCLCVLWSLGLPEAKQFIFNRVVYLMNNLTFSLHFRLKFYIKAKSFTSYIVVFSLPA